MIYIILAIILSIVVVVPILYSIFMFVACLIESLIHPDRKDDYHGSIWLRNHPEDAKRDMIDIGAYRYGSKDHSTSVHITFGKNMSEEADEQQRLKDRQREENLRRNQEMEVKLTPESYKE